jgi:GTP cyclohydrolase IA
MHGEGFPGDGTTQRRVTLDPDKFSTTRKFQDDGDRGRLPEIGQTKDETSARHLLESLTAWHDVEENHRARTPARLVNMLKQMTEREEFEFTTFPAKSQDMITLGPIPFYSLCAHHVVPFFGSAYIGYVPDASIAGLSKFARTVKQRAKGFWVQEELTHDIAAYLEGKLSPLGTAVVLRAEHLCMAMRGIEQPGVVTTTSAMHGVFNDHTRTAKAEFMSIIGGN